jgi:hypothetical protein
MPATAESTRTIESALAARLHELGVDDVFTTAVTLSSDVRGLPTLIEIWLGPTESERLQFGFFRNGSEQES